ncbi:hypothetical protein DPMN_004232 [Dreissena polymorpha]|uniref:Uncharacterized protein n=1 Tax=Dreissena polymorpha TaxID=45954 RepID=A0A9D4RVG1_DREPO|nr:hypothetical protein DPMN_004232 [Dreissena polymorpha]
MWTDSQRTKTNPKTSPEQLAIFQLVQEINKTNAKNVTSIVKTAPLTWQPSKNVTSRVHDIQLTGTILTGRIENAQPTGGHVFSLICTIFELVRHINKTNVLINFHDDWAKIVTSRVFTRKTAPPTGGHLHEDWALNVTSTVFKLDRDFIGTNLLTKFHEDRTINVSSRVFTNKCGQTTDKDQSQKLT